MDHTNEALPDLRVGVSLGDIPHGVLTRARAGDDKLLIWRQDDRIRVFAAECTHLGAPLGDGLVVGDTVRCPWHHACFSLETGEACAAPAFAPLKQWKVESHGGRITLGDPLPTPGRIARREAPQPPKSIVIVGGGAGGFAAADHLHRHGYAGTLTVVSDDGDAPYDRTLLTKDFLSGDIGPEGLGISPQSLQDLGVDLRLGARVERIDRAAGQIALADGATLAYDRLLLAPGAAPKRLDVPGSDLPHVHLLRSAEDARRLVARLDAAKAVVVIGGSFIGTEAAASLRDRGLDVHLVALDTHPFERVLGRALSDLVVETHRAHGVKLHLGRGVARIGEHAVELDDGTVLACDEVVVGSGVEPRAELAKAAGLKVDDGIVVDPFLRTSDPAIFAVGDAASWPDPRSGRRIRVEHWAVAERQGQVAAANMLGPSLAFEVVPFFWTKQFDLSIRYVGHAGRPDEIQVDGDLATRDATIRYLVGGRILAVATVGRDIASLEAETRMDAEMRAGGSGGTEV